MLFENWKWVWRGSLHTVFKHPKIKNVIQILLNEISYQTLFFLGSQLVFKYWKLLFEISYQTEPKLSTFASVSNLLVAKKKKKTKTKQNETKRNKIFDNDMWVGSS